MSVPTQRPIERSLVTGAGGFIGSRLTEALLESGIGVTALDLDLSRIDHLASSPGCRLLQGDIEDAAVRRDALAGVDTVFHLAAAHLGTLQSEADFRRINVDATRGLAEASIESGARRFVHCSSVGVYGRLESPPADEETPCHPELPYEQTKLEGEVAIRQLIEERQLPAVILRPVWVYGPDCQRTRKLFEAIAKGRFLVAGKGDTLRHCLYIEDMVETMVHAATVDAAVGEILVIGDDRPVTIRFLVDEIARLTQARPPVSVPFAFMQALATTSEFAFKAVGREPPLSRRSLRFFTGNTAFRTDKARRVIDLRPRYDLARGLAETHRRIADGN